MRRLVAALGLIAAVVAVGVGQPTSETAQAQVASFSCVGPPADYIAAYDTVRGQPADGQVTYSYETVYIEFQGWVTPNDGVSVPGHHSEHIHEGACLPNDVTLTDANAASRYVDTKYVFHNVTNYTVTSASLSLIDKLNSAPGFASTPAELAELNAAAQASGDLETVTVFQSHVLAAATTNGIKEFRWAINVSRNSPAALVDEWRVSGRSYVTQNYAGLPLRDPLDCNIDFVRTQNWIKFFNEAGQNREPYTYAGFGDSWLSPTCDVTKFTPDVLAQARPDVWEPTVRLTDGASKASVFVNPNFHAHPDTYTWKTDLVAPAMQTNIPVSIPLGDLGLSGVNRLMVQGHKWPGTVQIQPIGTAVTVIPFFRAGDAPPSMPTGLVKSAPQESSLTLSWNASTDDVGVAGYRVYRDGVQVADITGTTRAVGGLSAPSHLLEVEAYDAVGNVSPRASVVATRSWE